MKRNVSPWICAAVVPIVVAASVVGSSLSASAQVSLPKKTAAQVLQFITTNPNLAFSGKVTKTANLGLPAVSALPSISQSRVDQMKKSLPKGMEDFVPKAAVQENMATVLGLISGTQQANVSYNDPSHIRVQMLDQLSERDLIVNGSNIWFYDEKQQSALHSLLPTPASLANKPRWTSAEKLPFDATSPASVADYFLRQIDPTTRVTIGTNELVAGRGAYVLTLTPKTKGSLVGSVRLAVDGQTGFPLAVTIDAVQQANSAFEIAFDSISFKATDTSLFAFAPPVGVTVQEMVTPSTPTESHNMPTPSTTEIAAASAEYEKLKAKGWAAVVEVPQSQLPSSQLAALKTNSYYRNLTKKVRGGRIFSTSLLQVLFTNDGRIFAGAVTTQKLLDAAARP